MANIFRLHEVAQYSLSVRQPFNFRYTFWKPSHFPTRLELHTATNTWRSFMCPNEMPLGLRFSWDGLKIQVRVFAGRGLSVKQDILMKDRIVYSYGLQEDISDFLSIASAHRATSDAVSRFGGMRMSCPESLFEIGLLAILLQNTTIARTTQMFDLLLTAYGSTLEFDGVQLRCFFGPQRLAKVPSNELRERCRLGYRAVTVAALTKHFARRSNTKSHLYDVTYRDQQSLMQDLMRIRGIGPFTANVIASHALRQTNDPALDVWSTRIAAKRLGLDENTERQEVRSHLMHEFPGLAALALLYMLEAEAAANPLVALVSDSCPNNIPNMR